jgi:hypothetical protein
MARSLKSERLAKERLGAINKNTYGSTMKITEYNNSYDILVKFEQGNTVHTNWQAFCKGEVTNVFDKSVCNVGYIGQGIYKTSENGKKTKINETWHKMLQRCYDEKFQEREPTYKGCFVCEDWLNFQNFGNWFDENYYEVQGEIMHLDKDILLKGNKIYSPDTCVFVPQRINCLFIKSDASRGNYPIGVNYHKVNNKYIARCNIDKGERKYLGSFNTPEEAFNSYKIFKENYIKVVAEYHKNKIPKNLYYALLSYEVDIND